MDKGTIAWKVVREFGRVSCVVNAPKYMLKYSKGHTVHAVEGTIGIMCFETEREALGFREIWGTTVLKVRGFGRRQFRLQAYWSNTWSNYNLDYFYSKDRRPANSVVRPLVPGTILFDRVDVLT